MKLVVLVCTCKYYWWHLTQSRYIPSTFWDLVYRLQNRPYVRWIGHGSSEKTLKLLMARVGTTACSVRYVCTDTDYVIGHSGILCSVCGA